MVRTPFYVRAVNIPEVSRDFNDFSFGRQAHQGRPMGRHRSVPSPPIDEYAICAESCARVRENTTEGQEQLFGVTTDGGSILTLRVRAGRMVAPSTFKGIERAVVWNAHESSGCHAF